MATTARTAGEPRARTVRGRKFFANRDWVWLAVFLIPAFLVVVVLQFYPLAYSAFISVQDWRLTESQTPQGFIGLANFSSILTDPVFQRAVSNSALITGGGVLIELLLGFTLAFLTIGSSWTMRSIRTLLILPMVIAPVAAGTLFRMILNSRSGLLLVFLSWLHIASPEWLAAPAWARVSVTMLEIWQWTPFVLLVVAAGITAIPDEILEAASIDGAGRWQNSLAGAVAPAGPGAAPGGHVSHPGVAAFPGRRLLFDRGRPWLFDLHANVYDLHSWPKELQPGRGRGHFLDFHGIFEHPDYPDVLVAPPERAVAVLIFAVGALI